MYKNEIRYIECVPISADINNYVSFKYLINKIEEIGSAVYVVTKDKKINLQELL